MGTLADSVDPDELAYIPTSRQSMHLFQKQKYFLSWNIYTGHFISLALA